MRMPFSLSKDPAVSSIEVPISLSVDDMTRQWVYFGTPRTDAERAKSLHKVDFNTAPVEVKQTIINGRNCPNYKELKLDEASFELVSDFDVTSKFSNDDFYKMQSGEMDIEEYHKSVAEYAKKKMGCDKVICMHSQVRNQDKTEGGVQSYAGHGPHTDSSAVSGDQTALTMLEQHGEDPKDYRRYAYINLWKNISEDSPIQNDHLAMMDERTAVKPDDYLPRDLIMDTGGLTQYGLNARHAHLHKWYYFPQMTNKEAILFKQMDSDHTKSGRICFHMSVHDKDGPTTPSRESIETRFLCFWKATGDAADSTMPTEENTHKSMIKDPKQFAEDLAKGISSTSLESASVFALVLMLLAKIPLLGRLVPLSLVVSGEDSSGPSNYSGKPEDYAPNFVGAIEFFPKWPGFAKTYITGMIKRAKDYDTGLLALTKLLCADAQNHMKVRSFKASEKKEICEFLLSHEPYLVLCKKHFGDLHE